MTNIIPPSELLKRAVAYIAESIKEHPEKTLQNILDEAGMRFNLGPLDSEALKRLFTDTEKNNK